MLRWLSADRLVLRVKTQLKDKVNLCLQVSKTRDHKHFGKRAYVLCLGRDIATGA